MADSRISLARRAMAKTGGRFAPSWAGPGGYSYEITEEGIKVTGSESSKTLQGGKSVVLPWDSKDPKNIAMIDAILEQAPDADVEAPAAAPAPETPTEEKPKPSWPMDVVERNNADPSHRWNTPDGKPAPKEPEPSWPMDVAERRVASGEFDERPVEEARLAERQAAKAEDAPKVTSRVSVEEPPKVTSRVSVEEPPSAAWRRSSTYADSKRAAILRALGLSEEDPEAAAWPMDVASRRISEGEFE